jgi:predicted kinase
MKQAIHDRNVNNHDQSKAIMRLEREKTALVEANNLLEQTLATERLKVINAENVKKIAMKYSGEVKESYDFYRAFYEKQTTLYDQYFAPRGTEMSSEE